MSYLTNGTRRRRRRSQRPQSLSSLGVVLLLSVALWATVVYSVYELARWLF